MGIKISQAFPSKWLKADDIGEHRKVRCTIREAVMETAGDEDKIVIYFNGKDKGLLLNKTNAGRLAVAYGDDTDGWMDKQVLLFVEQVAFQGRMVPGIRVEVPRVEASWEEPKAQAPPPQQVQPGSYRPEAWSEPSTQSVQRSQAPPDEEIPF